MRLAAGTRIGTHEIMSQLGAGGMGEVYRARDTKLGREVAIKILPAAFTADPERRGRFEREARVLASLNHPHIGAIYGVEDDGNVHALVLELVEGETLAGKLESLKGKGLGISQSLSLARQIADALDAAHERGIVHRDLKPANIAITADGVVKVLDFGLAKSESGGPGFEELTNSPTMIVDATWQGMLLGTAPYMSPEQARGKAVDKRTDIWAFGCVLYEMLTGLRAFSAETTTDTLVAILEREPDWSMLPSSDLAKHHASDSALPRKSSQAAAPRHRRCAPRSRGCRQCSCGCTRSCVRHPHRIDSRDRGVDGAGCRSRRIHPSRPHRLTATAVELARADAPHIR
jgi:serine/threonine protein kinase